MLASDINVCLATDSLASNPDLSVLREAQFLLQRDQTDPYTLLEMITRRAAAALGLGSQIGSITPNKYADLCLYPPATLELDPIEYIARLAPDPTAVWINGTPIDMAGWAT
jgi:cytosine/adenosine deaminase-related metal-dependent hydrolase